MRFPEISLHYHKNKVPLLAYPGAFNQTTGPLHWEALLRARAIDTQCYVAGVACARAKGVKYNGNDVYQSWGHTILVGPDGKIIQ